ncbi:MAG: DNA alkylation repair protein [Candidatus Altiarchaeota archaeon]
MNIDPVVSDFRRNFKSLGTPERALQEKRYLKSPWKHYGVTVPKVHSLAKSFRKEHPDISEKDLYTLARRLWSSDWHEEKSLAIFLLHGYPRHLDYIHLPVYETMLKSAVGWCHVDEISAHLVGEVLLKDERVYENLARWNKDENFWMRRASLVSQLVIIRAGRDDLEFLFQMCTHLLHQKEFFIRKAIGWVLREASKKHPDEVYNFLLEHREEASGLTLREGSKKLSKKQREKIVGKKKM